MTEVDRLLEGFGRLIAEVEHRFDRELPVLGETLLGIMEPSLGAPIPSMAIARFEGPSEARPQPGLSIPRGSLIHPIGSSGHGDLAWCEFRTGPQAAYWPVEVTQFESGGDRLRLRLETTADGGFDELGRLGLDRLRLFLQGDADLTFRLAQVLLSRVRPPRLVPVGGGRPAARGRIGQVGLDLRTDGLLPAERRAFAGARLLAEYFAFPEKFLFIELGGFPTIFPRRPSTGAVGGGVGPAVMALDFVLPFRRAGRLTGLGQVKPANFRTNCVPVINLFRSHGNALRVDPPRSPIRVVTERPRGTYEVYSVDAVYGQEGGRRVEYAAIHQRRHRDQLQPPAAYWQASRQDQDVVLTLLDPRPGQPPPPGRMIFADVTCTNGRLPAERLKAEAPFSWVKTGPPLTFRLVTAPTPMLRPPSPEGAWRRLARLARSHLEFGTSEESLQALRGAIVEAAGEERVVDPPQDDYTKAHRQRLDRIEDGLIGVACEPGLFEIPDPTISSGPCRGLALTLTFDARKFPGKAPYVFAAVLAGYLELSTSLNSCIRTIARTTDGRRIGRWDPVPGLRMSP